MKMKELEAATGIGRETIRYYIREGLLPEPVRPKRNVAAYGREHVNRLNLIRRLQQERHLPLSVIKTIVNSEIVDTPTQGFERLIGLEIALGPLLAEGRQLSPMRVEDVARTTGISIEDIRAFDESGFIFIDRREDGDWLNQRNVRLMELIAEARGLGFTPEIGYSVESYDIYVQMTDWMARRAVVGFYSRLGEKLDQPEAARLGVAGIRFLNEVLPLMMIERIVRLVEQVSASGGELPRIEGED